MAANDPVTAKAGSSLGILDGDGQYSAGRGSLRLGKSRLTQTYAGITDYLGDYSARWSRGHREAQRCGPGGGVVGL